MPITHETNPTNSEELLAQDQPVINITDLNFSYPDGHTALHGISMQIQQGEKVALVGQIGRASCRER